MVLSGGVIKPPCTFFHSSHFFCFALLLSRDSGDQTCRAVLPVCLACSSRIQSLYSFLIAILEMKDQRCVINIVLQPITKCSTVPSRRGGHVI